MSDRTLLLPGYVASLAPKDLSDARRLVSLAPAWATAIEYRLDLADSPLDPRRLLELDPRAVILTYRTLREGGRFGGSTEEYSRVVAAAYAAGAVVDVEHSSCLLADPHWLPDRSRVVVSLHAPFGLPEDWRDRLSAMRATNARVVKLVAGAADLRSSLRVAALQREVPGAVAAIFPMGPASPPGRVLSAYFGAALVYGSVEAETAGGQIPLEEFLSVYEVVRPRRIDALFGIVGENTAHSLSPLLHNALFRAHELPNLYLPLPVSDFARERPDRIEFDPPFRGFSVTRPWKRDAAGVAFSISDDVAQTGAANTLLRTGAAGRAPGKDAWRAENTDVDGVFDPLADHDTGEGRTAVVLGAGGTARAAVVAARRLGYEVALSARRDDAADAVAEALRIDSLGWGDLASSEADLYVNATPVGGTNGDASPIPPGALANRPLVFDCVYRRDGAETATVRAARAAGCSVVDGRKMFAAQAVRQAQLFGMKDVTPGEVERVLNGGLAR